jgi:5-methyltetrahydropteroyltriglutamate--homocysteine methyltransferase
MTIADSVADRFYGDKKKLGKVVAEVLNYEVRALAKAGCKWIQVDEPVFARYVNEAIKYGIENLERCFYGVPKFVNKCMHMCCGYPDKVDEDPSIAEKKKADSGAYVRLADGLDEAEVDVVSIEDAHRHNDLGLLEKFTRTKVALGVIEIASSRVESVEEIGNRLNQVLGHIDKERLMVAGMVPTSCTTRSSVKTASERLRSSSN